MNMNRKRFTLIALGVIVTFAMAGGLLSVKSVSPGMAFAQEKEHGDHIQDQHKDQGHNEDIEELFNDEETQGHEHEEPSHDEHADHNERAEHDEHDTHDEQAEHDEHDGHDDEDDGHEEGGPIRLSSDELSEFGIVLAKANAAELEQYVDLPGEIVLNADQVAHVVPRVSGIIRQVNKKQGDQVRKGQVMAVIESRDLADSKAEYLAARERYELAQLNFAREERLWQKKITSEQEYLDARQAQVEARIALRSAEQKLHALGFSDDYLKGLPEQPDVTYTRYEIRVPFSGVVIQKHITLGEVLEENAEAFVIADLSTVWTDLQIYQKDLAAIRKGQNVTIQIGHGVSDARGAVDFVGPLLGEETRTALARVVLKNPDGHYRPGMFVTARVAVATTQVDIAVPKSALQTVDGRTVVFVKTPDGFEPRPVEIGQQNTVNVEVVSGLKPGDLYVSKGAFTLKAQLSKGSFGDGHNH
ncbi:MAG: efflux transporter periplasmic adaptor subunit [Desulfuromonas sp.]|nr:MAG: efflux transporter periplasmic adaptor subunit [Desulfuromonas sp.]